MGKHSVRVLKFSKAVLYLGTEAPLTRKDNMTENSPKKLVIAFKGAKGTMRM
jgi:hypothetical protein